MDRVNKVITYFIVFIYFLYNYIVNQYREIGIPKLTERGITTLEVQIFEAPGQSASFRSNIPNSIEEYESFINTPLAIEIKPCQFQK